MSTCSGDGTTYRAKLYGELVHYCEELFPRLKPFPAYRQTRKLRKDLEKGKAVSDSGKAGLLIRRLVKQSPGLTPEIIQEILLDPAVADSRWQTLQEFISIFGILAATRLGFVTYYPELDWSEVGV